MPVRKRLSYLRENNTQAYSDNPHRSPPQCLTHIIADKTTITAILTQNCLSLRNNPALLHSCL